ncbi:MAG TPA: hypothetical protein GX014_03230 [Firmicutes bacterium]|nr:hypothetical protein [Bacillota bacterium]
MKYRFEVERKDYSDFASGRVLYSAPNTTAFPVRLASEIVQRAFDILEAKGAKGPYTIYDPCCGGGFLLATVGFLFSERIAELIGTDIDPDVLEVAAKNLSLLSQAGLEGRERELQGFEAAFGKASHREALASLGRLRALLGGREIKTSCQQRDIATPNAFPIAGSDIVMTDLPYGQLVSWAGEQSSTPLEGLFQNCHGALKKDASVLIIVADKKTKLQHELFKRIQYFKLGKRQIAFFEPLEL